MSLQNYDPSKPKKLIFTYDSLHNNIMALKRQVDKTKQFSEELDVIKSMEDVKKNFRVQKTFEDCKKKYDIYKAAYENFKQHEPPNPLQPEMEQTLLAIKRTNDQLTRTLASIDKRAKIKEDELNKEAAEKAAQEAEMRQKSLEQKQEEQMGADLEHTANELNEIGEQAALLNSITHQVDDKLSEQHETVVKINDTIEDAKSEMIAGNQDLEEAEADQKAGSIIKGPKLPCCSIC